MMILFHISVGNLMLWAAGKSSSIYRFVALNVHSSEEDIQESIILELTVQT